MNFDFLNTAMPVNMQTTEVVCNILVACFLGLAIAFIYQKSHKGLSYSQAFSGALVLLPMITAVVMMVIGNNVAKAFTLVGALSIIRFRTAIKDPRDIAFVFMSLVIGMAAGTTNYFIATLSSAIILTVVMILSNTNFGSILKHEYILRFLYTGDERSDELHKDIFQKYLDSNFLLTMNSIEEGKLLELSYNVKLKDNRQLDTFIKELDGLRSVQNIQVISAKNDIDY